MGNGQIDIDDARGALEAVKRMKVLAVGFGNKKAVKCADKLLVIISKRIRLMTANGTSK